MVNKIKRICKLCKKDFLVWPHKIKDKGGIYCSRLCRAKDVGKRISGKNNYAWTGNKPKYHTLHNWIYKKLGKAKACKHCNKVSNWIQWANISGKYKRSLKDFISLCIPCHRKWDTQGRIKWSKCKCGNKNYYAKQKCHKCYLKNYYLKTKNK